jgi:hypothetical protein
MLPIILLLLLLLLLIIITLRQQLLREMHHQHATRGLHEQLAAMQHKQHYNYYRAE